METFSWCTYSVVVLIVHNYYRRKRPHDLHNNLSGHVSPFWRGALKASMTFASGIKVEVGDSCSNRFWLDYWVGHDTLAFMFPNLFLIAIDSSAIVSTQTYLFGGRMIWSPQFRRWPFQNLLNDPNNLLNLLQPKKLSPLTKVFGIGSSNKMDSSPSTPSIEALPIIVKRKIVSDGFRLHKFR